MTVRPERHRLPVDRPPLTAAAVALLPLRAFLGITFCVAGLQKLANPGFLNATNPASIQAQLAGSVRSSPIHALISPLTHVAVAVGLVIAFGELAVGLGTLLGLWTRLAAAGGVALSLMLFLAVSFHANPYYTGSDIVFVFAWTPLLIGGATVYSVDAVLDARAAAAQPPPGGRGLNARGRDPRGLDPRGLDRRSFTARGTATVLTAVGGLSLSAITAAAGRMLAGPTQSSAGSGSPALSAGSPPSSPASSPATSPPASSGPAHRPGGRRPAGTRIGPASGVPVGGAASFTDPKSGDPALVVQPSAGRFLAFDAVCPHAGCTVGYQSSARMFVCPCHGSQFNGQTGAVIAGPAPRGLTPIRVTKGPGGQLYAD